MARRKGHKSRPNPIARAVRTIRPSRIPSGKHYQRKPRITP